MRRIKRLDRGHEIEFTGVSSLLAVPIIFLTMLTIWLIYAVVMFIILSPILFMFWIIWIALS